MTVQNRRSLERLAYTVAEASQVSGIGRTTLYALMSSNQLPYRQLNKKRLIPADALRRLVGVEAA